MTRPWLGLRLIATLGLWLVLVVGFYWPMPPEPDSAYGRMVVDRQGVLLRAWLNADEQFRMPPVGELCPKYVQALQLYEDRRFRTHLGVDGRALLRATVQNVKAGRVVSGASTLTMQMVRLRSPRSRTLWAKLSEALQALRWERQWSKDRLLRHYSTLVPMGGNVVGIDAAAWRYLGHDASQLTWAQASLFAVLPNRPSRNNPERGRDELLERRNQLLQRLFEHQHLDSLTLQSALVEPLPDGRKPLPFHAPHFSHWVASQNSHALLCTSLDAGMQVRAERLAGEYLGRRAQSWGSELSQVAVLVMETHTGKVRAWVGSADYWDTTALGRNNGVLARRSTGSALKPFLYALALQRGPYTRGSLLEDVPTRFGDFQPQNADESFRGWTRMDQALVQSLNVPAVRLLQDIGVDEFHHWLQKAGLRVPRSPAHYGLSLILGGAEASLAEMVPLYATLYSGGLFRSLQPWEEDLAPHTVPMILHPGAAYLVVDWLTSVQRPEFHQYHRWFDRQIPVAWKTGTSYGSRDAWAIGVNEQWTIGVWVGDFRGSALPGLSGAASAAPLLFELFADFTDRTRPTWHQRDAQGEGPVRLALEHLDTLEVCALSGYAKGPSCPQGRIALVPKGERRHRPCPLHRAIVVNPQGHQVCSRCWNIHDTLHIHAEVHPPQVRSALARLGQSVPGLPPHQSGCAAFHQPQSIQWVYPVEGLEMLLPRDLRGRSQPLMAEVVHRNPDAQLQWWLDGSHIGVTQGRHRLPVSVGAGEHLLWVEDGVGGEAAVSFSLKGTL